MAVVEALHTIVTKVSQEEGRLILPTGDQPNEAQIGVVVLRSICTEWLQRGGSSVREPVRMPSNRVEHDPVNVAQGGFTSSGYDHE